MLYTNTTAPCALRGTIQRMTLPRAQSVVTAEALTEALAAALPAELVDRAPALAVLLVGLADGAVPPGASLDPALKAALRALAGSAVAVAGASVSFGSGSQFGDITIGDVVGGDKLTVSIAVPASRLSPRDQRNRRAMLARLRTIWVDGLLARTFAEVGRAAIGLVAAPDLLERPLAARVQELGAPQARPPAYPDALAAFDAAGGALLLLGAPGAGKTTMLIELAGALLDRAETDESQPIPVIFPLSSWVSRRLPLGSWLVEALAAEYDVPREVGAAWRDTDAILPLLDGLDEVDEAQRPACAAAINAFRTTSFAPLVVCSRADEYRALPERLRLQLAVELQPLDETGRAALLAGAGPAAASVAALLTTDEALAELADTPLMLAVMARALGGDAPGRAVPCPTCGRMLQPEERSCPACGWSAGGDPIALRASLVAAYVECVFARRGAETALPREVVAAGLRWIAGRMDAHGRTTFHLEDLQPDWLASNGQRLAYAWLDRLGGALLASAACLIVVVPVSLSAGASILPTDPWLLYPLSAALFGGVAAAGRQRTAVRIVRDALQGAGVGLLAGLLFGLVGYFVDVQRRALFEGVDFDPLRAAISVAVTSGFAGALAGALYGMLTGPPGLGLRRIVPVERVRWSLRRGLVSVPVGIALGAAVWGLVGLVSGLPLAMIAIYLAAGPPAILGDGVTPELLPLAIVSALVFAALGAGIGVVYGLIGGLAAALEAGTVTPYATPGAGLRRSARSAATAGLFFLFAGGLSGLLLLAAGARVLSALEEGVTIGWSFYLYAGALFAVQIGSVGALCFGGYTLSSHLALRLVLWRAGLLPWRLGALLEEGAERALLRRVGGGYIFLHRVFLEHFAGSAAPQPGEGAGQP